MFYNKLDAPDVIFVQIFGVSKPLDVDENLTDLPEFENEDSERYMGTNKDEPKKELFVAGCVLLSHI